MPREKELFRDNLARLDAAYPGKEVLTKQEVREYFGDRSMKYVTCYLRRKGQGWTGNAITKVELARALS